MEFFVCLAELAFAALKQAFGIDTIFHYFEQECHIHIETDVSHHAIDEIISQLTLQNWS